MSDVQILDGFSAPVEPAKTGDQVFNPSLPEQLWRSVLSNKWAIISIVLASLILGLLTTLLMTPEYTANARIEISRQQDNVTNVEGLSPETQGVDLEFYETQYSLLRARSLADRVVRALNLTTDESFFEEYGVDPDAGGVLDIGSGNQGLTAERRSARSDLAAKILLEKVSINPVRGSSLVDVRMTSPSATLSTRLTNAWVQQFMQSSLDRRFASTQDAREFLEERLGELREKLQESERALVTYASNKEIVTLSESVDSEGRTTGEQTLVGADLQAMNIALAEARANRILAQSRAQQGGGRRDGLNNQAINSLRQKRAEIVSQRANLLTKFEAEYPAVRALTSEIASLDRSISQEESRVRQTGQAEYAEAVQRERELAGRVDALKNRFIGQNRDSIQYNIYQREVDTNRALYDSLLQRYKEIGVAGVGANNIAVVDLAEVPDEPSSPNMAINLLTALFLGLGAAGAFIFVREQVDQSLRDPADVKSVFGLALLGTVPSVDQDDINEDLSDKKSSLSEAYFSIGTTLSFLTDHGAPKSILVTSTQPNEGKTTSAYALASVASRSLGKTLLIDADLRNPSLHEIGDRSNHAGLSNLLTSGGDIQSLVAKDSDKLDVLFSGPIPPNPGELLTGSRFKEIIDHALTIYDYVLVDGPPVLGLADVPLLSKSVEGLIFTIQANGAKVRSIQTALARLHTANANLFGAIVTRIDSRNSSYGYGDTYGYGHQYGSEK